MTSRVGFEPRTQEGWGDGPRSLWRDRGFPADRGAKAQSRLAPLEDPGEGQVERPRGGDTVFYGEALGIQLMGKYKLVHE